MEIKYVNRKNYGSLEEWRAMLEFVIPDLETYPKRIKALGRKVEYPLEFVSDENFNIICRQIDPVKFEVQYSENWREGKKMNELHEAIAYQITKRDMKEREGR